MNLSLEKFPRYAMDQKMSTGTFGSKDESFTKTEDEFSLSEGVDSLLNKASHSSHFNFENVRFIPKIIEFIDAFEGKQFSVKITIQNIGRNPVWVKIGEPNSFIFQLKKPSKRTKFLAAGASITKTVNYTYHNVDLIQKSQIPVQINGQLVDYPIVVKKAVPDIEVQPQKLDFKVVNLGASAKTLVLTIYNKGGKRTKFKVDVGKNILDLVVTPMGGTIRAKSQVNVLVEMMGFTEGDYDQELWIKTNEMAIRIPVLVKVIRPRLEIVYPNGTEDFTLITFPPTFNGTQRTQPFVLKNCSTDTTLFCTFAEVNGELQILSNARSTTDAFNMFKITAEEGQLEPFENRICSILFQPKAVVSKKNWHHIEDEKKRSRWEHIVFLRIDRAQSIGRRESKTEISALQHKTKAKNAIFLGNHAKTIQKLEFALDRVNHSADGRRNFLADISLREEKVLRLCLHGNAVAPDFLIQPDSFDFGDLYLGQTVNKVLRITNNTIIPVKCKLCKVVNVKATPAECWIKNERAHEFDIDLSPRSAGRFKSIMKIQILAQSDVVFNADKALKIVAEYEVVLNFNAKDTFKLPSPKIGLGITPLITDEVGLEKDLITFKDADKIPFAAILKLKQGFQTAWMKKEEDKLNNVDNAIVALPNDRPRLFYTWPKEKICRTIFGGFFRYAPPEDITYTLSPQERNQRKEHLENWANYLAFLRELRRLKYPNWEEVNLCLEYDLSCKKHYSMKQIKTLAEAQSSVKNSKALKCSKESKDSADYTFVPLSPLLLAKITVEPKFINFNQVAVNSVALQEITIRNMNEFCISIKFVSGKSAVSIMESDTITVQPSETKEILVLFQTCDLGRYFGLLNYVINGSHEFKITISAFVTSKTLSLGDTPLSIHFGMYDQKEAFHPRSVFVPMKNLLQAPIKYRWEISPDSAFVINVTDGEIPPRCTLFAEVIFDMCPRKSFYSEMTLISESGEMEAVKLVHTSKKVAVSFVSNRIDMHDIPLNLPTKAKAIIENACYHEVAFVVLDANPLPGINIEPKQGLIKARSFFPLEINVKIPVIMKFHFSAVLIVHFVNKISVKVTGNVVPPVVRIKPSEVVMRKICAHAVDTFAINVENQGTTPTEVFVNFKNCPEYKIVDNNHKLHLLPSQSSKFIIQFEPTDVSRHMFYLPVTVNRILGPPEMQEPDTEYMCFYIEQYESMYETHGDVFNSAESGLKIPCVCLNSTVTPSLLSVSPLKLNFTLQNSTQTQLESENITFTNDFNDDITFCIRTDDLGAVNDSPFNLIPVATDSVEERQKSLKVNLRQNESLVVKAIFEPKRPGSYCVDIPIFVKGYSNGLVYNFIALRGELKPPTITTETSEIHFPPLPLEVGCDVNVMVCAENYNTPETINCVVYDASEENGDGMSQYVKTKWLTEPKVSPCQKASTLQLQIYFFSCIPVAVKNYVLIFDSMGTYSCIFVTAIADNSVLTAHAFLCTRSTKYRMIRDKPPQIWERPRISSFPVIRSVLKTSEKNLKEKKPIECHSSEGPDPANSQCALQIDKGPKLIIQETKSMSRSTQLNFVNVSRRLPDCKNSSSTFLYATKSKLVQSFISGTESASNSKLFRVPSMMKRPDLMNDVSYPNFPVQDGGYKTHFEETLRYVERWMFEVVMQCDQYFSIPVSFQRLIEHEKSSKKSKKLRVSETRTEKDFLDFLMEIVGPDPALPKWKVSGEDNYPETKAIKLRSLYAEILLFLENKGCLLPHVRPEFLMEYENYILYANEIKNTESFSWKSAEVVNVNSMKILQDVLVRSRSEKDGVPQTSSLILYPRDSWQKSFFEEFMQGSEIETENFEKKNSEQKETFKEKPEPSRDLIKGKQFSYKQETLDKVNFQLRSTQAWLDIVTQIFRALIMKGIAPKNTIPRISVVGMNEKIPVQTVLLNHDENFNVERNSAVQPVFFEDSHASNVYTLQERILMDWLNHHCQIQSKILWNQKPRSESPSMKVINNFDKDLSDSIALIAVTASHCPYIVSEFFDDVFQKPDTPVKLYHNAGQLIQAWRLLEIGLTVETSDIVQPNPVFMVMLVVQLYKVLPSLHPHSLICFSAPLTKETTRVIQLKNDFKERIFYKAKFFGEHEGFFQSGKSPLIELKPVRTTEVHLTFTARKIKRISATLILSATCASPHFGKHLAFYLEGEPSELNEREKFFFTAPLYKVVCISIPVKPPFAKPATYEVGYTTKKPEYSDSVDISTVVKPWSKIRNKKVSRRLFLNQSEVIIDDSTEGATLSVTVACLTDQNRFFWLVFRSKVCDFIILVEIKTRLMDIQTPITGFLSQNWTPSAACLCKNGKFLPKPNSESPRGCPFFTTVNIPTRNDVLWNALWVMFLKTLQPHEKSFWSKHFEMDIGICLILWLLSPDEEENVIDEFIQALPTRATYRLKVEPPNDVHVTIPSRIEISDVRKKSQIALPIHISKTAPSTLHFKLTMTSESSKEIRSLMIKLTPRSEVMEEQDSSKSSRVQVVPSRPLVCCKKRK